MRVDFRDDRGIAMITAVLVMLIVAAMATMALTLSSHSLDQSGLEKSRVQAVHAAEAGVDRLFLYFDQTPATSVACNPFPTAQTLPSTPQERYQVTVTYYDVNGAPLTCTSGSPAAPKSVLIRSVGTVAGATPKRTMEALVRLTTSGASSFGNEAIYSNSTTTITGGGAVNGNPDNADIYSAGDLTISGGAVVWGAVRTLGKLTIAGGGTQVKKDAFAKNAVEFQGLGSEVFGSANSSTANISGTGKVDKDANACTGIALNTVVLGARNPSACPAPPPTRAFLTYPAYDRNVWEAAGYTIREFTGSGTTPCTQAASFIKSNPSGNNAIRVASTCMLTIDGNPKNVNLNGNMAVLSDGGLALAGGDFFTSADGSPHNLYLIFGLANSCPAGNVTLNGGTYTGLDMLVYTPCKASNTGSALNASGSIYAGSVDLSGGSVLNYKGLTVPGLSTSAYKQDIVYIREVVG